MQLRELLCDKNIGVFTHVEVSLVVLKDKQSKEYWIYFCHANFDMKLTEEISTKWLTPTPISINPNLQVLISKQVLKVEKFLSIYEYVEANQEWRNGEESGYTDSVFAIEARFVPETDPTGTLSSDNSLVPLELAFYGSNFSGNYYICELFSAKQKLQTLVNNSDIKEIQKLMKNAGLQYDLSRMKDRIGNVVCKIPVKIVCHKPLKLSPNRGISGSFSKVISTENEMKCTLQILSEYDGMLVSNRISVFSLRDQESFEYEIPPNRYTNRIILSDNETGIVYYMAVRDYSFGSDYYHTITPPQFFHQRLPNMREIVREEVTVKVPLTNLSGVGEISIPKDIYEINQRRNYWTEDFAHEHNYFHAFNDGQREQALNSIRKIVNDKSLFWDLKEIWLIDPYLMPDDILDTVVYCEKYKISVRCLTSINTINGNAVTKISNENGALSSFENTKNTFREQLEKAIPKSCDLGLEYRTVFGNHGKAFHDRYLVLKYGVNKTRVWSLGISLNQIGESHHIIQIVESPAEVECIIDDIWMQTDVPECLIYKN